MPDQRSAVLYLARKGMKVTAIHQDPFTTLNLDAVSYLTVTRILQDTLCMHEQSPPQEPTVESHPSAVDLAITQALNDEQFASVRQLAQRTDLPTSTVHCHSVNTLGFTKDIYTGFLKGRFKAKSRFGLNRQRPSWDRCTWGSRMAGERL
jgi:hypothetical protein